MITGCTRCSNTNTIKTISYCKCCDGNPMDELRDLRKQVKDLELDNERMKNKIIRLATIINEK